jgi:hypothetical protein
MSPEKAAEFWQCHKSIYLLDKCHKSIYLLDKYIYLLDKYEKLRSVRNIMAKKKRTKSHAHFSVSSSFLLKYEDVETTRLWSQTEKIEKSKKYCGSIFVFGREELELFKVLLGKYLQKCFINLGMSSYTPSFLWYLMSRCWILSNVFSEWIDK